MLEESFSYWDIKRVRKEHRGRKDGSTLQALPRNVRASYMIYKLKAAIMFTHQNIFSLRSRLH